VADEYDDDDDADAVPLVRPYSRTGGRTRSSTNIDLAIEALVSTSDLGRSRSGQLDGTHQPIAELCAQSRSVAEVAALLRIPLGVARVLIADMVGLGLAVVHKTADPDATGGVPISLMERVLAGLHRL
jgi:hypothetical protein